MESNTALKDHRFNGVTSYPGWREDRIPAVKVKAGSVLHLNLPRDLNLKEARLTGSLAGTDILWQNEGVLAMRCSSPGVATFRLSDGNVLYTFILHVSHPDDEENQNGDDDDDSETLDEPTLELLRFMVPHTDSFTVAGLVNMLATRHAYRIMDRLSASEQRNLRGVWVAAQRLPEPK